MMRRCALIACGAALWAGAAGADERSAALVEAFRAVCASDLPNFARIEATAAAENLPVNLNAGIPRGAGPFNHIKSWIVSLPSGTHELSAVEARGPAGEVATCAITAGDARGDEVKQELMRALNIGPPERENVTPDRMRRSAWRLQLHGHSLILLLMDATPTNAPGVYLNITHRLVAGS
jgi:hypothetical protein